MASFSYVAVDSKGNQKKGSIEAENQEKVTVVLKNEGLMPIEIKEQGVLDKDIKISLGSAVKPRDLSVFCRQFVSIVSAGVTIINALDMLSEQTQNKVMAKAIKEVQVSVEKGETLANSMKMHEKVFPSMLINMVEAGEKSGSLEVSFERMAVQFEKDAKLKGLIQKAMIYPIVVCCVAIGVVFIMLTFVIPNFTSMFDDMDVKMPKITLAVIAMSGFMKQYWYIILGAVGLAALGLNIFKQSPTGKDIFGKIAIKMPIFGQFTTKTASSRLARTLSTLLCAGVPMIEAIEITSRTMGNIHFQKALMDAKDDVAKGIPLSEPLERCRLFPPMIYQMTKIGEETGDIESMLEKLADYYDEEVEVATQSMMAALEPLIIIVLAVVVGGLIGAVMAPMMSMYEGLDNL
ncbi:type II secretion system F family protein [Anaerosacchariphilus polymeriproducens]|uniref:Type II secretion system F family protein n=1 Tax=Anaerosacchariphilus polymeriproducens TaxID=1812858 RepID=A0A371AQJ5_9FIRM|nr:type II secretion system F family protein [Anaerosacchariphilus polymeriproducens]RDU21851.1 type II secretion system F family protein [Anaerosacchariphilus polymeriproducens]